MAKVTASITTKPRPSKASRGMRFIIVAIVANFIPTLYQIRGRCAAPMQDALSSLRPLRLESLGLLDRDGLSGVLIAFLCLVNSVIPIEIVAIDKI